MAGRAKVLLIDDDRDFRASVVSLLESEGYAVTEAECAKEGLEKAAGQRPDVIILDIMMENDFAGYGVNQAIKYQDRFETCHGIPIIMVSSIQETPDERFAMSGEVDMIRPDIYLTKPLDISKFLAIMERITGGGCTSRTA